MIIDLNDPRAAYFKDQSVHDVLSRFMEEKSRFTVADVRRLHQQGRAVAGIQGGDLEAILQQKPFEINSLLLIEQIRRMSTEQLLVLPENYRLNSAAARTVVAYDPRSLVKLDTQPVYHRILGERAPPRLLSKEQREKLHWNPEAVIAAAFNILHEQREALRERPFSSYSWYGQDHHRRVVSLFRAIQGAELRAFQDFAAYKMIIPLLQTEVRSGRDHKTRQLLSIAAKEHKRRQLRRYTEYLQRHNLESEVQRLDVSFKDLIELASCPFAYGTGYHLFVPSRSRPEQRHRVKLTSVPRVVPGDPRAYSAVWDLHGESTSEDKSFFSDRRQAKPWQGQHEEFFSAHEIAAYHSLRTIYRHHRRRVPTNPFVLPTPEMIKLAQRLRYGTILIEFGSPRPSLRTLNHTEIENMLWRKVLADGYEPCFSTDLRKLAHYDLASKLVHFKR